MSILQQDKVIGEAAEVLLAGQVRHYCGAGRLDVVAGSIWLTNAGDPRDHMLGPGQSLELGTAGDALVEGWGGSDDAVVVWHAAPGAEGDERAAARPATSRCWELADPFRRRALGAAAALAMTLAGALVFGPLADTRIEALASAASRHNGSGPVALVAAENTAHAAVRRLAHRARFVAQEARRRAPGAA